MTARILVRFRAKDRGGLRPRGWMPGMSIAGEWYSSGTFWTGAGAAATLVVGIATVAVTYLTRFARPRLDYGLRTVAPLLTAPDGVRDDLELRHRGVRLEHPYLVQVMLIGRGRRDIPRSAFDNDDPIRLDLGTPIVELLQIETTDEASATPAPPVRADGTALLVGPGLIGRRQRIALTALVADRPSLRCEAPLPNARVRQERHPLGGRPRTLIDIGSSLGFGIGVVWLSALLLGTILALLKVLSG